MNFTKPDSLIEVTYQDAKYYLHGFAHLDDIADPNERKELIDALGMKLDPNDNVVFMVLSKNQNSGWDDPGVKIISMINPYPSAIHSEGCEYTRMESPEIKFT